MAPPAASMGATGRHDRYRHRGAWRNIASCCRRRASAGRRSRAGSGRSGGLVHVRNGHPDGSVPGHGGAQRARPGPRRVGPGAPAEVGEVESTRSQCRLDAGWRSSTDAVVAKTENSACCLEPRRRTPTPAREAPLAERREEISACCGRGRPSSGSWTGDRPVERLAGTACSAGDGGRPDWRSLLRHSPALPAPRPGPATVGRVIAGAPAGPRQLRAYPPGDARRAQLQQSEMYTPRGSPSQGALTRHRHAPPGRRQGSTGPTRPMPDHGVEPGSAC
jgi:hypothetical protein